MRTPDPFANPCLGSAEIAEAVDELLRSYPDNASQLVPVDTARAAGAIPVYGDMGGVLLLRRDGEVLLAAHDADVPPAVETDVMWRIVGLVRAAETYPSLAAVRPRRPADSHDCSKCDGAGEVAIESIRLTCGDCMGLGWQV